MKVKKDIVKISNVTIAILLIIFFSSLHINGTSQNINDIDYLLNVLISEDSNNKSLKIPKDFDEKKELLRSLMNVRPPRPISEEPLSKHDAALKDKKNFLRSLMYMKPPYPTSEEFLERQNKFLQDELSKVKVTDSSKLPVIKSNTRLCLWKGDITTLKVDAIVNAANKQLLGCFCPCHNCIDNIIHSKAGIQLRLECYEIMCKQGYLERTGSAKITNGYNLPCKKVIHTVGPIVGKKMTKKNCVDLGSCYKSCLELAEEEGLESIAFCCISTGEFRFPKQKAAQIAVNTVTDFLKTHDKIKSVIFNVYDSQNYKIYRELLGKDK